MKILLTQACFAEVTISSTLLQKILKEMKHKV